MAVTSPAKTTAARAPRLPSAALTLASGTVWAGAQIPPRNSPQTHQNFAIPTHIGHAPHRLSSCSGAVRCAVAIRDSVQAGRKTLNFRVKVEESVDAVPQLSLNLLTRAFQDMHCHLGLVSVIKRNGSRSNRRNLVSWEQPHAVYQHQISHRFMLRAPVGALNRLRCQYNQTQYV